MFLYGFFHPDWILPTPRICPPPEVRYTSHLHFFFPSLTDGHPFVILLFFPVLFVAQKPTRAGCFDSLFPFFFFEFLSCHSRSGSGPACALAALRPPNPLVPPLLLVYSLFEFPKRSSVIPFAPSFLQFVIYRPFSIRLIDLTSPFFIFSFFVAFNNTKSLPPPLTDVFKKFTSCYPRSRYLFFTPPIFPPLSHGWYHIGCCFDQLWAPPYT